MPFYKFYKFYTLKNSALHFLRCSTFFYKVLQTALRNTDFLHFSINSTLFLFCRKYIILIFRHLRFADICRTCSGVTVVLIRKNFSFSAKLVSYPDGTLGLSSFSGELFSFGRSPTGQAMQGCPSSMIFHVADSRWSFAMLQNISHRFAPLLSLTHSFGFLC